MNNIKSFILIISGVVIGSVASYLLLPSSSTSQDNLTSQEEALKPLYWVAPMDDNYRRDKPGQSPMGMDLVAVYPQSTANSSEEDAIFISPDVVNNLGVRTTKAMFSDLEKEIKTVGYIQYDEDKLVHIHPRVEGWIEKLYVNTAGAPVTKGQPIYDIYSPSLVNAQDELLLALDSKNKRLINASEDRLKALQVPKSAIAALKKSKKVKQTITFYAPDDGVIDNLNIREGFYVKPGTTLMSIGNLSQVWVIAEIFERQAAEVHKGDLVSMSLDYMKGRQWQGEVDYVYPVLDAKTRTTKIRLRFDNADAALKPNMFAQVIVHLTDTTKGLLVPNESVIRTGAMDRVVLALGDGYFKSIAVKVGRFDQTSTEILSGLNAGDLVVSSAQFLLDSESSKSSDFKRMNWQPDTEAVNTEMNMESEND
jgi:Cu(I)/Ag(I) efflux system membrane fusion protein